MKRVLTASALMAVSAFLVSGGTARAESSLQRMQYQVYAGGINAVEATLALEEKADRYAVDIDAHTRGFLAKIVPWQGTFSTEGWRKNDALKPEHHRSTAVSGDETEEKNYRYGRDGSFRAYHVVEQGRDTTPEVLDPDLTRGTTDALSAALSVMNSVGKGKPCEGSAEVFDGDRRFRLVFRPVGEEQLTATRYNVYEGPAVMCVAEVVPVTGKWHKKPRGWLSIQEQGRKAGTLPTLWMAKIDKDGPAVPVKMRVKTDYGTLFMHLVNYTGGAAKKAEVARKGKRHGS